jgi:hypothetical protein
MSEENVAILRRGFTAFGEDGTPDLTTIHPQVEIINFDSFPVTRPYHGHDGLMQWLRRYQRAVRRLRVRAGRDTR